MPSSNNSGGPWGGGNKGSGGDGPWGGGNRGGDDRNPNGGGGGGRGPGPEGPDMDEMLRQGRDKLQQMFGGGGNGGRGGRGRGPQPDGIGRAGWVIGGVAIVGAWLAASMYTVQEGYKSVELMFGAEYRVVDAGLHVAPWPIVTHEVLPVEIENTVTLGDGATTRTGRAVDAGLMLTGDENIVDIDFNVVWKINDPARFLFNLADPDSTILAVSESAMREVIGRSEMKPILNRDRAAISQEVEELIQATLDGYNSGVEIVRLNLDRVDPPREVIDAFRDVQAASQDRDRAEKQAEAYANERLAKARGQSAQLVQEAEGYSARVVNEAEGQAARFTSIYEEYAQARDVTRKRLYLETMERVLGGVNKVVIDGNVAGGEGGQGVIPFLPLGDMTKRGGN